MDELLQQFLIESRELVSQAIEDLLEIEKTPGDIDLFDDAFRAFHTLKGGAGIVEFAAMEEALHVAEDVLAAARAAAAPLSTEDVGNCLECLDQVTEWLDVIQSTGALPSDADATIVTARFARTARTNVATKTIGADDWVATLFAKHPDSVARAVTALRYRPEADSFFRHRDPVALIAALPGLLAVDVAPASTWPPLEELDPFSCNLVITALLATPSSDAATILGDELPKCDMESLDQSAATSDSHAVVEPARDILEAQVELLANRRGRPNAGYIAAAGAVATNVLRYLGRGVEADRIAAVAAACAAQLDAEPLRQAIVAALADEPAARAVEPTEATRHESRAQTLRVDAARIDALVKLTGELIVAKNAIGHTVKLAEAEDSPLAPTLKNRHAALARLVSELQRSVLGMRVLPLRVAFQRFPRLLREMSAHLGKPARLVMEGEDTEADKAIVEILVEPLLHVLRNAMDHGIEKASVRAAASKPPVATIHMRAFRQGEHVLLEVADDGGGIDVARVRQVALDRKVLPIEALESMSDPEMIDLIFAPGFSTAAKVTDLSGRGVGMDAVRTAVKRLGGQVEVGTVAGQGTTVRFTLPFSVMMTQVMTVEAGGQVFGIPLDAVVETIRVSSASIFAVGAAHAIVLRDRTVPLVDLANVLGTAANERGDGEDDAAIVVAKVEGELGALRVDKVGERLEIMLKPLDGLLSGLPGIAGSTLLGDGSVLLILDLAELLQ